MIQINCQVELYKRPVIYNRSYDNIISRSIMKQSKKRIFGLAIVIVLMLIPLMVGVAYSYDYLGLDPDLDRESVLDEMSFDEVMEYYDTWDLLDYLDEWDMIDYLSDRYSKAELAELFEIETDIDSKEIDYYDYDSVAQALDYEGVLEYPEMYSYLVKECMMPNVSDTLAGISFICPEKMTYFFDLADEFGCEPSMILGTYCEDYENHVIHYTDNVIDEKIPYENMGFPFLNY